MRRTFNLLCGICLGAAMLLGMPRLSAAQAAAGSGTAEAKKRIKEMDQELRSLKAEKDKIKARLQSEFLEKDEWKDTLSRHKIAKAAYESAKKKALAKTKASPEYKTLASERAALVAKQDEFTKKGNADPEEISDVGTELAKKATTLKNMEKAAVEQDETALSAKEEYLAAEKERKALDAEVEDALLSDPDFEALDLQIEQAETQLAAAKDQLAQQQKSENAARAAARASSSGGASGGRGMGKMGKSGRGGKGGKGGKGYQ